MSSKIVYGSLTFGDDEIIDGEIYEAVSLLSDVLEIGTLTVSLMINDAAIGQQLLAFRRNDKLFYYHNDALIGTFYVQNVERTEKNVYDLKADNAISLLQQSNHYGGIYDGQTVQEVLADICNIPYIAQERLLSTKLYGWLPIDTRRANLAQVLFAIGAVTKVDQDGVLRIEALWDGVVATLSPDRVFVGDKVRYESKVTEVSVLEHTYIKGTDEVKLFEGNTQNGDVIQFSGPCFDLVAEGLTILEQGANYAKVSAGSGTITGKQYTDSTRDVRKVVTPDDVENVVSVKNATLVSIVNSSFVLDRMVSYYKALQTMQNKVRYQNEKPGDVLAFEHPFGGESVGTIKETSIVLGRNPVSSEKTLIDYKPEAVTSSEYFDFSEEITEDTEWTVPDDVTSVTAVLIGPGQGGWSGNSGQSSPRPPQIQEEGYYGYNAGEGGAGGAGGSVGNGGKILQSTLEVIPGQQISAHIGTGGSGGNNASSSSQQGVFGDDTTFGELSTANGASNPAGFTDVLTGKVYAQPGKFPGIAGGKGSGSNGTSAGYTQGPPVSDRDGNTWYAGNITNSSENVESEWAAQSAQAGRGCGGGAAVGSNGSDGGFGSAGYRTVTGGSSGHGGDAQPPAKATQRGGGGDGGHGGGGEGGLGLAAATTTYQTSINLGSRGGPGNGSVGGQGGDGIILLFYRKPKPVRAGGLIGKNGKFLLDRTGRLLVT